MISNSSARSARAPIYSLTKRAHYTRNKPFVKSQYLHGESTPPPLSTDPQWLKPAVYWYDYSSPDMAECATQAVDIVAITACPVPSAAVESSIGNKIRPLSLQVNLTSAIKTRELDKLPGPPAYWPYANATITQLIVQVKSTLGCSTSADIMNRIKSAIFKRAGDQPEDSMFIAPNRTDIRIIGEFHTKFDGQTVQYLFNDTAQKIIIPASEQNCSFNFNFTPDMEITFDHTGSVVTRLLQNHIYWVVYYNMAGGEYTDTDLRAYMNAKFRYIDSEN